MDHSKTIHILEALVSGCSPSTGEMITNDSVLNERDVIRALQIAIGALKIPLLKDHRQENETGKSAKNLFRSIDFFTKQKFNHLSQETMVELKKRISDLGISKKDENLPEYMKKARETYPRAYEPWSIEERELLAEAIKFTNDAEILAECFQRGKGSIESFGQKLIYDSQSRNEEVQAR